MSRSDNSHAAKWVYFKESKNICKTSFRSMNKVTLKMD